MELYGYGEDALTLWVLCNHVDQLLADLGDVSEPNACIIFYRPSFGRRGGERSPQFGEFDFLLLTPNQIYLGESKWIPPGQRTTQVPEPDQHQLDRHAIFRAYVERWRAEKPSSWSAFFSTAHQLDWGGEKPKPLPGTGTRLASNLEAVLTMIASFYADFVGELTIIDVLLILHGDSPPLESPASKWCIVRMNYTERMAQRGPYVRLIP